MVTVVSTSVVLNPNPAFFPRHQPSASPSLLRLSPRPSFSLLSDSTRTLSSLLALALSASRIVLSSARPLEVPLSWFPNIPWDRQPLSAIRDLCDPYLNLFRNIITPAFDTFDVSPLLAFAVLGTLGSILNNSRGMY